MRKSNSIFKTAFVSESGSELKNNDYFAYVEFDDYACYVLASGITDFESSVAAKEAVEHLILSFQEKPGLSKSSLIKYMEETNERLLNSTHAYKLKASVIMVVTDYEKFRYVSAGNVRLRMYRQGRFLSKSKDMSLANDLIERGESDTVLDRHEERHNLYSYLGKKDFFKPYVSKTSKLEDSDIIALYSQGLWEHVDEQEIDEIFSEATDDPQESVDVLEEVLLSRQPKNLKSYTITAIFVNKAYRDPEREHRRQFYIKVAIIILVIILIIALIAYLFHSWKKNKVEQLDNMMNTTIEYMDAANFKRAHESCMEALKLAKDLHEKEKEDLLKNYLMLFDALVEAEDHSFANRYVKAFFSFKNALKLSSVADKNVIEYINEQLSNVQRHIGMEDFMALGDIAFKDGKFDEAEGMYSRARDRAEELHDLDGQRKAMQAIEKLYDKKAQLQKDADQKLNEKKQTAMNDALKKGDDLLAAGDFEGAQIAYLNARNLSDNPADRQITSNALGQLSNAKEKKELQEKNSAEVLQNKQKEAFDLEKQGDKAFDDRDYLTAQMYYMQAMEIYHELKDQGRAETVKNKSAVAEAQSLSSRGEKMQAEDTETAAREYYRNKNYLQARASAINAKELYLGLGMKNKADEMDVLLQQIAVDATISDALK